MSFRDRKFELVLYPLEDETHAHALHRIRFERNLFGGADFEYLYITHDKDIDVKSGELIKSHVHLLLFGFTNPRFSSSISDTLGIKESSVQSVKQLRAAMRYLIHADADFEKDGKFQYRPDAVDGSIFGLNQFEDACETENAIEDAFRNLFDFVVNHVGRVSKKGVADYAMNCGLLRAYSRYYKILSDVIDEHNEIYRKEISQ